MNDSLIHLRVPAATKGRWVRASRAAGQRLTDYITCAVEAYMQQQLDRAEDLLGEVHAEDAAGPHVSHAPGRA